MRSLDFWWLEGSRMHENWVLMELPDIYAQIVIDVFARLPEFNKARPAGPVAIPDSGAMR